MQHAHRLLAMALACLLFSASCKKDKVDPVPTHDENTITEVGVPDGTAVSKSIGTTGGELSSADGVLKIIIPAGALPAAKNISIQAITNKLPQGIGHAYRLSPHGEQFLKPVTIVFNYQPQDLTNTIPQFLDIAYQDAKGTWQALMNSTVDTISRKITVNTTHFSDWGYFKSLQMTPRQATVELRGEVALKVTTTFPLMDPDDDPTHQQKPIYTSPRELRPDELKGWSYSGEGKLVPGGSNARYTAPDHEPAANPEAVAVNINMHRKGQFMVLAHMTVLAGHAVDYLQVDEDSQSPINHGKCMLYIWGKFGTDPGAGKRSVLINGTSVDVNLWSPTVIRCGIDESIFGAIEIISNNKTIARSVLRRYIGKFLYTRYHGGQLNAGSSNALKETSAFEFVYRGFGSPCPTTVNKLFQIESGLASGTCSKYSLSGSASVTTPVINGCSHTTSVSLPDTKDWAWLLPHSLYDMDQPFDAQVKETATGINVKLDYYVNNVIKGVIVKRSNSCGGSSFDTPRNLGVSFEGFDNTWIQLEFVGPDKMKLKGSNELKSARLSSDILIEAWDGTGQISHYEIDGLVPATFRDNN